MILYSFAKSRDTVMCPREGQPVFLCRHMMSAPMLGGYELDCRRQLISSMGNNDRA